MYGVLYPALVQYLLDMWLRTYMEYLVRAWIDKHQHLSTHITSQVEGACSVLKTYLQVSTGDLFTVYNKSKLLLLNQHTEFEADIADNKRRTPHTSRDPFYAELLGRISSFALRKL
jgi:hypothetical protein